MIAPPPALLGSLLLSTALAYALDIGASQDSWIKSTESAENFGNDDRIVVLTSDEEIRRGMVMFEIPAAKSALLWMGLKLKTSTSDISVHAIPSTWIEEDVTWETAPSEAQSNDLLLAEVLDTVQLSNRANELNTRIAFNVTNAITALCSNADQQTSTICRVSFLFSSNNVRWTEFHTREGVLVNGLSHDLIPTLDIIEQEPLVSKSVRLVASDFDTFIRYPKKLWSRSRNSANPFLHVKTGAQVKDPTVSFVAFSINVTDGKSLSGHLELALLRLHLVDLQVGGDEDTVLTHIVHRAPSQLELLGKHASHLLSATNGEALVFSTNQQGNVIEVDVTSLITESNVLIQGTVMFAIAPMHNTAPHTAKYASREGLSHGYYPPQLLLVRNNVTVPSPTAAPFESQCLARSTSDPNVAVKVVAGEQLDQGGGYPESNGTVYDASDATWPGWHEERDGSLTPLHWPVTLRYDSVSGRGSCWYGGRIEGVWDENDPAVTWEDPFHHAGGFTNLGVPNLLVEGISVTNQGDGIHWLAPNGHLRGIHLENIHDDCIENDNLETMLVEDSFLDGCCQGLSARACCGARIDGSNNIWTIRNSLIRMEAQPGVAKPDQWEAPGHQDLFKFDYINDSPKLVLQNTVFRADQDSIHGTVGLTEPIQLHECSNNIMVWLGDGPFPGYLPEDCFEVTTDIRVWERKVEEWRMRHGVE